MNKKGFTLVELIMVIIILGIISAMTIPMVLESFSSSKQKSGESIHDMLISNLKMYNRDNMEDLWCDPDDYLEADGFDADSFKDCLSSLTDKRYTKEEGDFPSSISYSVSENDLKKKNPNIDLGDCTITNLIITQKLNYVPSSGNINDVKVSYDFNASIKCPNYNS